MTTANDAGIAKAGSMYARQMVGGFDTAPPMESDIPQRFPAAAWRRSASCARGSRPSMTAPRHAG